MSDVTIDLRSNEMLVHNQKAEPWKVTLIDTGENTMTGGRLRRVRDQLRDEECFCFTYGDGVSDVDIGALVNFHRQHGKLATVTAVSLPGRYGSLAMDGDAVTGFVEKPPGDGGVINGGFFVLSPKVIDYIDGDTVPWEAQPMEQLAAEGQLQAFHHDGFWQAMDTLRDKMTLENLWATDHAPWKNWR